MMAGSSRPFTILEHSGDLRIQATGRDYLEALAHASLGMVSQIVDLDSIEEHEEQAIGVEGNDDIERAVAFLNELLYLIYARKWLPCRVRRLTQCDRKGCNRLDAILVGEPLDTSRHDFHYDVKAVTYHDFTIETRDENTMITFVCDL